MIRKLLIAISPIALWAILSAETMYSTGIAGRTGAPGESNCSGCHTGSAVNSAGGSITLNNPSMPGNVYTPGQTYTMSITVARTGINLFGFGMVALTASNQNAGTINVTDAASTQIKTATVLSVVRRNLVHTAGGGAGSGSKTFNFSWTAPAVGTGNVTFYFAGNAANANTLSSGDYIYTGSLALTEAPCNVPATPAAITGAAAYCSGTSGQLSVTADPSATGYTWTLPNGWSGSSTTNSITVTAGSSSGNVTVTANNLCGSSPASILPVTSTTVSATVTTTAVACYGSATGSAQVITAGGNAPYTYQWTPAVSTSSGATGLAAGSYAVTVTDAGGCTATRSFTITQPPALLASAGPAQTACFGSTVTFGGSPTATGGTAPYSYLWSNGSGITYATANPSFTATTTSSWQLTVTDASGCTSGGAVSLNVNPLPPVPIISFVNDTLVASVSGNLQWYLNGSPLIAATGQRYLPTVNGDYTVVITDAATGCTNSSAVYTYLSTGTGQLKESDPIRIYPVPADDHLIVDVVSGVRTESATVLDLFGRTVLTVAPQAGEIRISTTGLPSGIYYLLFGSTYQRFLVRH